MEDLLLVRLDDPLTRADSDQSDADWKCQCAVWKARYENLRVELDEFTLSSRELEHELEQELNQYKHYSDQLKTDTQTLVLENRSLKDHEERHSKRIVVLENQIKEYENQRQSFFQYRRELEQKNDDLETANRNLAASLADNAKRIEELMEVKAVLENELEHTLSQKEIEQRLRDELKDLQDELGAKGKPGQEMSHTDPSYCGQHCQPVPDDCHMAISNPDFDIMRLQALALGHFEFWPSVAVTEDSLSFHGGISNKKVIGNITGSIIQIIRKITNLESGLLNATSKSHVETP
ncbi:nuclear distribution protein nudE-like 1-A [Paramacrobiotus metropolitanus]|uniref:nuclear distribution protein nudE-like 1-A n=1 Tax=Paramacrobiotus metropolitanus TaxID=2943436 RepID=UPI00244623BE|nr:nuclear distribution protein nudE-like 1-A [Paramacrobiotus metropolitanus]